MKKKKSVWTISWSEKAVRQLSKLDRSVQKKMLIFLTRITRLENPETSGKRLTGNKFGLWRYRMEDYRIICQIKKNELSVLVLRVGHRKDVYDRRL